MKKIFYKPDNGWAADAIPFYHDGEFHIFYLHDYRNPEEYGEGTPWFKVTTKDFVNFEERGEMLARGDESQYDMYVFTGSVFKDSDGLFHIWYTGHNTKLVKDYIQVVMHAVSRDLEHWTKIPQDTFGAVEGFEVADWRDPFVWYDEKSRVYKMLLSARKSSGGKNRRGVTILLTSPDNRSWTVEKPFWQPDLYYAHECPDLFKIGDWYYHVYSEFSDNNFTRYVMSKSLDGPWLQPADDAFDGRAYYAAKTVSDGKNTYIIGWNPTREGESDDGKWQWGGSLVAHKLVQRADGTLGCACPEGVENAFAAESGCDLSGLKRDTRGACEVFYSDKRADGVYRVDLEFTYGEGSNKFGLLLNADREGDSAYAYIVDPLSGKMSFGLFPDFPQCAFDSRGLERPVNIKAGVKNRLTVIVEDTVCVAYLNGEYALNARMYGKKTGVTAVMLQGKIELNSIKIEKLKEKK